MKKFKITMLAFLMFAGVTSVQAQDEDNKWALSFGINAVDFNRGDLNDIGAMIGDYVGTSDWNVLPAISTVSVSRYTNYGLSVKVSGSLNK
ncbi:MAG: OmpA family protein, partial [Flavicella sp.]|nr:OmpA family protein [Flavicella sp.]